MVTNAIPSLTFAELNVVATDVMIVRYTVVATLCLMIVEYSATLEEEIRLVWPSKVSLAKFIFLVNRYLPFLTMIGATYDVVTCTTDSVCRPLFMATGILCCTQYCVAEAILFMRAYAVWGKSQTILCLLIFISLGTGAGAYYTTIKLVSAMLSVTEIRLFPMGCLLYFQSRIGWIALVILAFAEILSLSLLLIKGIEHYRETKSALTRTLYKDGVLYFVAVLMTTIVDLVVVLTASSFMSSFLLITQGVFHSVLCNRLLLRIRSALRVNDSVEEKTLPWQARVSLREHSYPMTDVSNLSA